MKGVIVSSLVCLALVSVSWRVNVREIEFEDVDPDEILTSEKPLLSDLNNWQRPAGPLRVGLQVGHWKNNELPDELEKLREQGGGTKGGGKAEWEVNLAIARATKELLEKKNIVVDILPATVPPSYWADVFLSIHADGSSSVSTSGFKVASPWRDPTGKAQELVKILEEEYQKTTQMKQDGNITRNMRGYYAFSWWKYEHAIHPMTIAAIIETGFLTSPEDQKILINNPEKSAEGIANGIIRFFNS